jgi:hypothetical protein
MVDALPGAAAGLDYVTAAIAERLSPTGQESGRAAALTGS